jgi:hypothetical protein
MKTNMSINPMLILKVGLASLLIVSSCPALAEYYMVYGPWPSDTCYYRYECASPCYRSAYVYIRSTAPYRHNESDQYQASEYEWVGDP